jgi:hypothetical protein
LRLTTPRDPKTGETRRKLWLWVIPFLIGIAVWELALTSYVDGLWVSLFPFFAEPPGYSLGAFLESQEMLDRLVGAWWFFALFVVNAIFNTILGGVSLSGCVAAPDGGRIWQVELGSKRSAVWLLSPSPALGNPRVCH